MGVVVRETARETRMATDKVTENSRNKRPTMPPMSKRGMNTATKETLMERTVKPISCAPCNAACMGPMPCSMYRMMFSITTMASSTTKPVEMVRAMRDKLSKLKPARYITPKVPIKETGTTTLGMNVARRLRKNANTTRTTRKMAITRVTSTSRTEARMVTV